VLCLFRSQRISSYVHTTTSALLAACPNLGTLKLEQCTNDAPTPSRDDPIPAGHAHTKLHTLWWDDCQKGWKLPPLPSLTALLLDGWQREAEEDEHTVNQVASQLTRLRLGGIEDLSTLEPYLAGLTHNLQRLELPWMELRDDVFKVVNELLPGLRCVEVNSLSLHSSHADVECSWREVRVDSDSVQDLQQLAWLPLARAGRHTRGLQRLVLPPRITCLVNPGDVGANAAAVCSSTCQLSPLNEIGDLSLRFRDSRALESVLPLLACFAPGSMLTLTLSLHNTWGQGVAAMSHSALEALAAAAVTTGGTAALARCHKLNLDCDGFQDDAACAALLPMLMVTPIATVDMPFHISVKRLTAMCSPDALASVTRSITLHVCCDSEPDGAQQVEAAIDAAGKAELVRLVY
jgi:hypothetical protein